MKAGMIILTVSLFICTRGRSATIFSDSLPPVSKFSETEFTARYGTDDSSIALVNYFFLKRKKAGTRMIWSGALSAAVITATAILSEDLGEGEPAALRGVFLIVIATPLIATFTTFFIKAFVNRFFSYSKKRLYRVLMDYHNGKGIPLRIKKDILFRQFVAAERAERQ